MFGLAGRGTALIAVNGQGYSSDPPARVRAMGSLVTLSIKLHHTYSPPPQGVTLDLAAPEEHQLVGTWGQGMHMPHDVTIARSARHTLCRNSKK